MLDSPRTGWPPPHPKRRRLGFHLQPLSADLPDPRSVGALSCRSGRWGILERLNRTFKHEFVFRHEVNTLADLQALLPAFQRWSNEQRLHSHFAYRTPAAVLAQEVAILS